MEGFNLGEQSVSFEKIKGKYHYTYSDGNVLGCPILTEFDADDQVSADDKFALFIQESGIDISESEIRRTEVKN